MLTTTLRGGQVFSVQVAESLAPSWGVSCPYCQCRNDVGIGVPRRCHSCDGMFFMPAGALSVAQVTTRGMMGLLMDALAKGPR